MEQDEGRMAAATFLTQALGLTELPAMLAADLLPVSDVPPVRAWAVELASNGEPAAFLVYAYDLEGHDAEGVDGDTVRRRDLEVMAEAAERNAPGPRPVAEGAVGRWALVLTTTPAVLERLTGTGAELEQPIDIEMAALAPESLAERRDEAARALLEVLRAADARAAALGALLAVPGPGAQPGGAGVAELLLFLLDRRSLTNLNRAVRDLLDLAEPD
ncbi:MAG: hypothetical protein IT337_04480 [Thermomicrobiales bacterium]|nr:hypothetical protein [Thermomicrobiales bacterium]